MGGVGPPSPNLPKILLTVGTYRPITSGPRWGTSTTATTATNRRSRACGEQRRGAGLLAALGRISDADDDGVAEAFFASLKIALIDRQIWPTQAAAHLAIFAYSEVRNSGQATTRAGRAMMRLSRTVE